jgi:uncharacterized protein YecE (DUF72 family)
MGNRAKQEKAPRLTKAIKKNLEDLKRDIHTQHLEETKAYLYWHMCHRVPDARDSKSIREMFSKGYDATTIGAALDLTVERVVQGANARH